MVLADHLRELRARLSRVALVFVLAMVLALVFYKPLLDLVWAPYQYARDLLGEGVATDAYIAGATGPLLVQFRVAAVAAIVVTAPYWLYQMWAFVLPGLKPSEVKWSRLFAAIAGPLFVAGVALGYYVLPRALEILIGFTPDSMQNLIEFGEYFSFVTRILLVFGVAFELPLFVVMLNLAGVLPATALRKYRAWIVMAIFAFAAVATPPDPFSMVSLAIPLLFLFFAAEVIARINDRIRRRKAEGTAVADDEASPL
ncbi:twin-arginine translocase subunit TatC [Nocardioides limicola]|uniref:twin-arginine translocase subunit TatC n=1 Tax=Nocardioides limicola TaxID=2803368 RepID=UPI001EEF7EDE|nr:twin-arginine translocase subunit TatC [Nocardioides sp. DJM-14]